MKPNLRSWMATVVAVTGCWSSLWAQEWTAPIVPGVDVSTLDQTDKSDDDCVYTYNVKADAFYTYGMDWDTKAIATRLTDGDTTADMPHATWVVKAGENIKICSDKNRATSLDGRVNEPNNLWVDQDGTISYEKVLEDAYVYELSLKGEKIDVAWNYGGHLTTVNGKGYTQWAFIPKADIENGQYALYKAKKEMFAVYEALKNGGKTQNYADALTVALKAYDAVDATAQSVREATKVLLHAVVDGIETEIPANALFDNPDMLGTAGNIVNWSATERTPSWSEFEVYHEPFTLTQTQEVPNGLYKVVFHSLYRADGGSTGAPVLAVNNEYTADVPEMRTLDFGVGNNKNNNGWSVPIPNNMKSCGQALTHDDAVAVVDGIKVKDGQMTITVTESGNANWNNFQGFEIYYLGAINTALYQRLAVALETALMIESSYVCSSVLNQLQTAIDNAKQLTANNTEEELDAALSALNEVIPVAQMSVATNKLFETRSVSTDNIEGWTCTNSNSFGVNTWSIEGNSDNSGMTTPFVQNWTGAGGKLGNGFIRYTLPKVKNGGLYRITLLARILNESGDLNFSGASLVANDERLNVANGRACRNGIYENYSIVCHVDENGDLSFGFDLQDVTFNWIAFKDVKIEYLADGLSVADGEGLLPSDMDFENEKYSSMVKTALNTAKESFQSVLDVASYNALAEAVYTAESSMAAYVRLKKAMDDNNTKVQVLAQTGIDAYNAVVSPIEAGYNEGSIADTDIENRIKELDTAYLAMVKAQREENSDMTPVIVNHSFETGDMTGWHIEGTTEDMGVKPNSNNTYRTDGCDGNYLMNVWSRGLPLSQTVTDMPNGVYKLTVACANTGAVYKLMGKVAGSPDTNINKDRRFEDLSCVFSVSDGKIDLLLETDGTWYKADNFRLTYIGEHVDLDYTALETAVESAGQKVMGFDAGEYAPYNNKEVAKALAEAKELLEEHIALEQETVDALVSALAEDKWTVNEEEVNAVYDGDFAIQEVNETSPVELVGWFVDGEGLRRIIKDTEKYPGLTDASAQAAVFAWGGTNCLYGRTEGYAMPLAAYTVYELTFKQAGWEGQNNDFSASVLNEKGEGLVSTRFGKAVKGINEAGSLVPVTVRFRTGEAGNYVLTLIPNGNSVFTDVRIVKAKAEDIEVVFKAEYGTMMLPFEAEKPEGMKVFSVETSTQNGKYGTLNLNEMDKIEANVPYIIQREDEAHSIFTFNGVAYSPEETYTSGMLTGISKQMFAPVNSYVLQKQNGVLGFYRVDSDNIKVTPYHAYLDWTVAAEVNAFVFGNIGDATMVDDVVADADVIVDVYSINGVLVRKAVKAAEALKGLSKGLYIVNGVKIAVK